MQLPEFHNALRIMMSIDKHELTAAGIDADERTKCAGSPRTKMLTAWERFQNNPYRWFIRASDSDAQKLWGIIVARQRDAGIAL